MDPKSESNIPPNFAIIGHNHIDPLWRRGFRRAGYFNRQQIPAYIDFISLMFDNWLKLRPHGYTWSEGQASILREYLARHPERQSELRSAVKEGTLEITQAGETVQDSNLPGPEALIRNYLVAQPIYRELGAGNQDSMRIAWIEDAFGQTPNLPQILKGVGCEVVAAMRYKHPEGNFWVGLDGTRLPLLPFPTRRMIVARGRLRANCTTCGGTGCDACGNSGLDITESFAKQDVVEQLRQFCDGFLEDLKRTELDIPARDRATVILGADNEALPYLQLPEALREVEQLFDDKIKFKFTRFVDRWQENRKALDSESPAATEAFDDLNPVMPGCYITRIRLKQRNRELTNRLIQAEVKLANEAWQQGSPSNVPEEITRAWQDLCFTSFHDAITGTHIDTAYDELIELYDRVEVVAEKHLGRPNRSIPLPAHHTNAADSTTIKWGDFECSVEKSGLRQCLYKGLDLFGKSEATWQQPFWHIGELCLESDFGDAWGRRIEPLGITSNLLNTVALGTMQHLMNVEDDRVSWYGSYRGGHKKVHELKWRTTLKPSDDGCRLDFYIDVWWNTESKRLRAILPVASEATDAAWEVAYGHLTREFNGSALNYTQWHANEMEYPAMNWTWRTTPGVAPESGVAILNRGLPSVRWMPHRFDISLLRSPEAEFCQQEQSSWECWDNDGQRDTGHHQFAFSIYPHATTITPHEITQAGLAFNGGLISNLPFEAKGPVTVSAWKPAENGTGWVLRFYETNGAAGTAQLHFPEAVIISACDLLERPTGTETRTKDWQTDLKPFEIQTLFVQKI